ncbi:aminomethyltransferase [Candidatus Nitromaritima sp. SCGC AAA799-C22]|nr:aminomethyltransferase [Candidatus Nitromaritima sp. SCGC AAA799-C22]
METTLSSQEEHHHVRENAGYFFLDDWVLFSAAGADVLTYLQTQTTNDVSTLKPGQGQNSAIVDRKARIIATFSLHRAGEDSVVFLVESIQKEKLKNHLEAFLFREDVRLKPPNHILVTLQGPKSSLILRHVFPTLDALPEKPNDLCHFNLDGQPAVIINKTLTGEEGFVLAFPSRMKDNIRQLLLDAEKHHPLIQVDPRTREVFRVEAGIPLYGKDMDDKNILPETGLEHSSVSYNKGCYIGQEVIARIKTYGAPNFALMGLILDGDTLPAPESEIRLDSKKIGTTKSAVYSYSIKKNVAFAYIQKDHRSPEIELNVTLNETPFKVRTCLLPFYQPQTRKDRSRNLQEKALALYKEQEDLEQPITLLREAIELDPKNADAYEALGVFLSRQNKLDEAVALMKRLVEIAPGEIMAHTNLSIYYMKQGRIEEAEQEKAEATALQFEKAISENMDKKKKQEEAGKVRAERKQKISMFLQVLEIDPVDQVANFGLGSVYHELGRYDEALPPLQTVVKEYDDYSAAYVLLAKTLEQLSRPDEAIEIYRKGIAVASKKGDLMPLNEMQQRLNQLLHSDP